MLQFVNNSLRKLIWVLAEIILLGKKSLRAIIITQNETNTKQTNKKKTKEENTSNFGENSK